MSAPTVNITQSPWRAAIAITFGPLAATSTGTGGAPAIHAMRLAGGASCSSSADAGGACSFGMSISSKETDSPLR
jgi:hypothetical protein